ncbi:MAG: hypothetical protein HQL75_09680 [Magnetococcales bacterium]|nr:hypothetical protein [Magnetococcales bacterium]
MKKHFQALSAHINARSKNERIYLVLAVIIVTGAGWNTLVWEPFHRKNDEMIKNTQKVTEKIKELESIKRQILVNKDKDINRPMKEKLKLKQEELKELELALKDSARNFLSPGEMTQALRKMLGHLTDVELISMESLPGEGVHLKDIQNRIMQATGTENGQKNAPPTPNDNNPLEQDDVTLYRHGLNVTLEGKFLDIMRYLASMEALPWTFYWGGLDYGVTEEGHSQAKIFLSTMSFSDGYIGNDPDLTRTAEQVMSLPADETKEPPGNDPTVADPSFAMTQGKNPISDGKAEEKKTPPVHLTSILSSHNRKVAIINGRPLGERETFHGITVLSIHPMSVHILQDGQPQEIFLKATYPWVDKQLVIEAKP